MKTRTALATITTVALIAAVAAGQYAIDWRTIDGGGGTSVGGTFALSGTIGQPDAQPPPVMSGGTFELTGGFWAAAVPVPCDAPGDVNLNGALDGLDIQPFVDCLLIGGANCACADMNGDGSVTPADVPPFVAALLNP
jgi:hypothetical protein